MPDANDVVESVGDWIARMRSAPKVIYLYRVETDGRRSCSRGRGILRRIRVERFNIGDPALILPRFAHLYPSASGVIVAIKPDPIRDLFNEYTLRFPDGSTASIFEFQIAEARA